MRPPLTPQEFAALLVRSRNWHLVQAARARREVGSHEGMADKLEAEIRAMGFDPQPPMGPRAA